MNASRVKVLKVAALILALALVGIYLMGGVAHRDVQEYEAIGPVDAPSPIEVQVQDSGDVSRYAGLFEAWKYGPPFQVILIHSLGADTDVTSASIKRLVVRGEGEILIQASDVTLPIRSGTRTQGGETSQIKSLVYLHDDLLRKAASPLLVEGVVVLIRPSGPTELPFRREFALKRAQYVSWGM